MSFLWYVVVSNLVDKFVALNYDFGIVKVARRHRLVDVVRISTYHRTDEGQKAGSHERRGVLDILIAVREFKLQPMQANTKFILRSGNQEPI